MELRLHDHDPDKAAAKAASLGHMVLAEAADKPHGLRESYIVDPDGYVWVLDRPLAGEAARFPASVGVVALDAEPADIAPPAIGAIDLAAVIHGSDRPADGPAPRRRHRSRSCPCPLRLFPAVSCCGCLMLAWGD